MARIDGKDQVRLNRLQSIMDYLIEVDVYLCGSRSAPNEVVEKLHAAMDLVGFMRDSLRGVTVSSKHTKGIECLQ